MKSCLLLLSAILLAPGASAAEPTYLGAKDCLIKDGYAEGEGVLIMKRDGKQLSRYEGGLVRGLRQGPGYMTYANGDQYEGGFKDSRREGKGVYLSADGDEMQGDWKNGMLDGIASATYASGGRYDGGWKENEFHGRGRAVYIGGQVIEGMFDMGTAPGQTAPEIAPDDASYALNDSTPPTGSRLRRPQEKGQQCRNCIRQILCRDDAGAATPCRRGVPDAAPGRRASLPGQGHRGHVGVIDKAQAVGSGYGLLSLQVMVGSDGKATSVKVLATPDPDLGQAAVRIMMGETYTPGTCAGKPCAMMYPTKYHFR